MPRRVLREWPLDAVAYHIPLLLLPFRYWQLPSALDLFITYQPMLREAPMDSLLIVVGLDHFGADPSPCNFDHGIAVQTKDKSSPATPIFLE